MSTTETERKNLKAKVGQTLKRSADPQVRQVGQYFRLRTGGVSVTTAALYGKKLADDVDEAEAARHHIEALAELLGVEPDPMAVAEALAGMDGEADPTDPTAPDPEAGQATATGQKTSGEPDEIQRNDVGGLKDPQAALKHPEKFDDLRKLKSDGDSLTDEEADRILDEQLDEIAERGF